MLERARKAGKRALNFGKKYPRTTASIAVSAAASVSYAALTGQPPYMIACMTPLVASTFFSGEIRKNTQEERFKMFPPPLYFAMHGMYKEADECCLCLDANKEYGGHCPRKNTRELDDC